MIFTIKEKIRFFGETVASSYTLNEIQRNEIIRATQFRANIIGASAINSSPIPISVSTFDIPNANALSYDFFSNPIFNRVLQGESIDTIRQELIGVSEDFCRRKNKISIWKNKTSIKVEILFFYKP